MANSEFTTIFFEAPHRLKRTLKELSVIVGERNIMVLREATKYFEERFYGNVSGSEIHFDKPKGEFTVVIEGLKLKTHIPDPEIIEMLNGLLNQGLSMKTARETLAKETDISRRNLYRISLSMK